MSSQYTIKSSYKPSPNAKNNDARGQFLLNLPVLANPCAGVNLFEAEHSSNVIGNIPPIHKESRKGNYQTDSKADCKGTQRTHLADPLMASHIKADPKQIINTATNNKNSTRWSSYGRGCTTHNNTG